MQFLHIKVDDQKQLIFTGIMKAEYSMSWGKLLDLLSFSVFSIFSLWIGIVFLQETVDSIPCPTSRWQVHVVLLT